MMAGAEPDPINPMFVHRHRVPPMPGLWRFWCHLCDGPSAAGFTELPTAGDHARAHLAAWHPVPRAHAIVRARRLQAEIQSTLRRPA